MRWTAVLSILLALAVVVAGVAYTVDSGKPSGVSKESPKVASNLTITIYNINPNIEVEIPPSFELYGIVYYFAMGRNDSRVTDREGYIREVDKWFSPYRNHTAVLLLRKWLAGGDTHAKGYTNSLVEYFLENYTYPEDINVSKIYEMFNGSATDWLSPARRDFLRKFLPALKDFAEKSKFKEFYRTHLKYYWEDMSLYVSALEKLPPDEFMREYAGVTGVKYKFVHPYLVIVHGYNWIEEENGTQIWSAVGNLPLVRRDPQRTRWSYITAKDDFLELPLNKDYIDNPGLDELLYLGFIYHELGHDLTVPKLNDVPLELDRTGYLIDPVRKDMSYLATYDGHFYSVGLIYEGFADAWEDFVLSHLDPDYSKLIIDMQKAWGEFWVGYQYNLTEKYVELSQKEGKPFSDYVPQILKELQNFASRENVTKVYEENVPVTPLRAFDRASVTKRLVVVYGTDGNSEGENAAIKSIAERIAANLEEFYDRGFTGTNVIVKADVNVTPEDLRENVVLIGNPAVNTIAREMQNTFPLRFVKSKDGSWTIERDRNWNISSFVLTTNRDDPVVTGSLSNTSEAALLLAVRNPSNPANYIVWVAGTDENMTALFQNPTYYLSSYEIWSKNGIEIGFYIQPLRSSGG